MNQEWNTLNLNVLNFILLLNLSYPMEVIKEASFRSRFALFISGVDSEQSGKRRRFTEPSRLPMKQMKRFLKKRKLRKRIQNYVLKNVPKTSALYTIINSPLLRKTVAFTNVKRITGINKLARNVFPMRNGYRLLASGKQIVYKNLSHRINNVASKLSGDIETNPGPSVVDPTKTIVAPYSQGNSLVFGSNAGKQCVAMSLIAILFEFIYLIRTSSHLVEIMNVGNELYTRLSQSAGQDLLLLTELPEELCLRETMYRLEYTDSFFGNVHNVKVQLTPIFFTLGTKCLYPLEQLFEKIFSVALIVYIL